jgi:hypothetical protein
VADNGMRETGGKLTIIISADDKEKSHKRARIPGNGFRTVGRIVGTNKLHFHGGQKGLSIAVELLSRQGKRRWRKAFFGELARSMRRSGPLDHVESLRRSQNLHHIVLSLQNPPPRKYTVPCMVFSVNRF